jgi:transposase
VSYPEIGLHINVNQMDKKTKIRIRYDHEGNGLSYRTLGEKYGIGHTTIYAMLNPKAKKPQKTKVVPGQVQAEEDLLPDDIKTLKAKLREALLIIELQDNMLTIASKELGVDLRKKHGTRQSK